MTPAQVRAALEQIRKAKRELDRQEVLVILDHEELKLDAAGVRMAQRILGD